MAFIARIGSLPMMQAGGLVSGLASYGLAEIATRLVRICVVVVIARRVGPEAMGVAALTLSLFEIVRALANAGIGQRIISAGSAELACICNGAHRILGLWCLGVALVQLVVAFILHALGQPQAAMMLAVLAGVYLMMPGGLVQIFLLMREKRLAVTARISATQAIGDHLLTLALALVWPSAWAIVLPKLLTTPIWLILARRSHAWRPDPAHGHAPPAAFLRMGAGVIGGELVLAARSQCDNLIIGAMLGIHALGLYYFAFGAGLGITGSFVTAFQTVLFPQLSARTRLRARARYFRHALLVGYGIFLPVIVAQVMLAPIYVPLLFGSRWAAAVPLVSILGLAAVPLVAGTAMTAWMRAADKASIDAGVNLLAGVAALAGLTFGARWGLSGAAAGYAAGLTLVLLPYAASILSRNQRSRAGAFSRRQAS